MHGIRQDFRLAARGLFGSPGFTIAAVLALALGIGANSAVYSLLDSLFLQPLPYADADRLAMIWERNLPRKRERNLVNQGNFLAWRERSATFEDMAAFATLGRNLTGVADPEEIQGMASTASLFQVLGVEAALGRLYSEGDAGPGSPPVTVLSHRFWQRRFGGDPSVIGTSLQISGISTEIVGVLPPSFKFFSGTEDIYFPIPVTPDWRHSPARGVMVIGRLKPSETQQQARAELTSISADLARQRPEINRGWEAYPIPLRQDYTRQLRASAAVLAGAVGLVLLIACANVAGLLLTRSWGRSREMALRIALGAQRARIVRLLLAESLLLSALGAACAVALAMLGVELLQRFIPPELPVAPLTIGWGPVGFGLTLALLSTLLFGLAPAWVASRLQLTALLNRSRGQAGSRRSRSWRTGLVVAEVALSTLLLIGTGLLLRSLVALESVDPGFRSERILSMRVQPPRTRYPSPAARSDFFQRSLDEIRALPGVEAAAGNSFLPLSGSGSATSYVVEGLPRPQLGSEPVADIRPVTPGYFGTMGIALLSGRDFASQDGSEAVAVAIIDRTMAQKHWPGRSPLGASLTYSWDPPQTVRIIGVVGDVRHAGPSQPSRGKIYRPYAQESAFPFLSYVIRTSGDPERIAEAATAAVHRIDPAQPVAEIRTLESYRLAAVERPRLRTAFLSAFSILALILAAVGIYGLMSYAVAQQRREIGIHMALGARRSQILRRVVGRGLLTASLGLGMGLLLAGLLGKAVSGLLFEVSHLDPAAFAGAALLLALVALAASLLPAYRACKTDPIGVLKSE